MPSRPSSTSRSPRSAFTPCFPQAELSAPWSGSRPLPARACLEELGPDREYYEKPISSFDKEEHDSNYAPRKNGNIADWPPSQPDGFSDPYLMPSLTRNERLRLTMLWYHTRDIFEDGDFRLRLQEQIDLVQTFMGWDFAIMGTVSEDMFTRVATAGLPLALVPRRDSPCSHTINQEPGVSVPSCASFSRNNETEVKARQSSCFPISPMTGVSASSPV